MSLRKTFTTMIFDEQRMSYMTRFADSLTAKENSRFGAFITGPDGVGKSGVCLTTFLSCFARELPVIYIPKAVHWSEHARNQIEAGQYLMRIFFELNADIIEDSKTLRPYFEDQLEGKPIGDYSFNEFIGAMQEQKIERCGFIVDETQKLASAAVSSPIRTGRGAVVRDWNKKVLMKEFFVTDYLSWNGDPMKSFVSLLSAGPYGIQKFPIPESQMHRLKYVNPFSKEDTKLLLTARGSSPFFRMKLQDIADEVTDLTEGNPADLAVVYDSIDPGNDLADLRCSLGRIEGDLTLNKLDRAQWKWFDHIPRYFQKDAVLKIQDIIRSNVTYYSLKEIQLDNGNINRIISNNTVRPVSRMAASALHSVFSNEYIYFAPPLSSSEISTEQKRDENFRLQMEARIHSPKWEKSINAKAYSSLADIKKLDLKADLFYIATSLDDIRANTVHKSLWVPKEHSSLPFDGIILPAEFDYETPAIMYKASVLDPFCNSRINDIREMNEAKKKILGMYTNMSDILIVNFWHMKRKEAPVSTMPIPDLPVLIQEPYGSGSGDGKPSSDSLIDAFICDEEELMKLKISVHRPLMREHVPVVQKRSHY